MNSRFLKSLAVAACAWTMTSAALAQNYPERTVKVIMPYTVGGATDVLGRFYADKFTKEFGQSFIVDNRPGAGGNIGTAVAAKAAPDGYTLTIGTAATHAMNSGLYINPGYDPLRDFEPIGMMGRVTMAIAVAPKTGIRTWSELVEKSKSAQINLALPSTTAQLVHGLIERRVGAKLNGVSYKGSAGALTDLLGGHVDATIDTVSALQSNAQAGKLVPLAIFGTARSDFLPAVSTLTELGAPTIDAQGWFALFAPKGTPAPVLAKLNGAMKKFAQDPDTPRQLMKSGFDPMPVGDARSVSEFVKGEHDKWVATIKAANIKPE